MGLTDSKMVADVVSRACSDAEKSGKDDIKPVLTDPKILDLLHNLWSKLPDTAKRKIDPGMTTRRIGGTPENNRPKKVRKLKKSPDSKIALLPDLMAKIPAWNKDPLSFFNEGESKLELTRSPFDGMFTYMNKSTKRTEMDTIRLRFLKVMYYRLSGYVGWTQLHQKRAKRMAQTTSNSALLAWVDEGKRIDKLCRDIGCVEKLERSDQYFHLGNLFYSLPDVADYVVKELPFRGDPRREEIRRLKRRSSLCETEGRKKLEILAHKVLDTIWKAFQNAEFGLEQERHPGGYSLGQDAHSFTLSVPSPQQDDSTTLDDEHTSLDENIQSTLLHDPVHGSVVTLEDSTSNMHEGSPSGVESEAANLGYSTSPVDANQTHDEPSRKRRRLRGDGFVASALFGTSPSLPSNTNSAGNRGPTDVSEFPPSTNTLPQQNAINPYRPFFNDALDSSLGTKRSIESARSEPSKKHCQDHLSLSSSGHDNITFQSDVIPAGDPPLSEDTLGQRSSLGPASDSRLSEDVASQPSALDPFPASDFPHHIFDNPHELPDDLLDLPALDPFPASDFPHHLFDNPHGQPHQSAHKQFPDNVSSGISEDCSANPTASEYCSTRPIAHVNAPRGSTVDFTEQSNNPLLRTEPLNGNLPGESFPDRFRVPEDVQSETHRGTNPRLYVWPEKIGGSGAAQAVY